MVPAASDHMMLLRQAWMAMVKNTARSWAIVSLDKMKCQSVVPLVAGIVVFIKEMWRKQYITNRAKTDAGNTLPRYRMYLGVGLPGRNTMKGMKRVSIVATTPAATIMIC